MSSMSRDPQPPMSELTPRRLLDAFIILPLQSVPRLAANDGELLQRPKNTRVVPALGPSSVITPPVFGAGPRHSTTVAL